VLQNSAVSHQRKEKIPVIAMGFCALVRQNAASFCSMHVDSHRQSLIWKDGGKVSHIHAKAHSDRWPISNRP
jgi:hypothetical protein